MDPRLVIVTAAVACLASTQVARAESPPADFVAKTTETALACDAIYLQISDLPDASADEIAAAYASAIQARDLFTRFSGKSESDIMADVDAAVADVRELNYTDQVYRDLAKHCDASLAEITTTMGREGY